MGFLFSKKKNKQNRQNEFVKINYRKPKIKVHICGLWEDYETIIESVFGQNIIIKEDNNNDKYIPEKYDKALLTEKIIDKIDENISDDKTIESHAILCFGDDNDIDMLFDNIGLIRVIIVTKNDFNLKKNFGQNFIINIITEGKSDENLELNIKNSLKEIDKYYNEQNGEAGAISCPLNLLLVGRRHSGKSTFVNLILGKLLALEINDDEFSTLRISEYIAHKEKEDKENIIKIIDTPGIEINNEREKIVIEKVNDFNKNKEKQTINIILFFFNAADSVENCKNLLKAIDKNKIPVFFIINKSIEKTSPVQEIKTKISFFKKNGFSNLLNKKNFIQANIKSGKDLFGMDSIFEKIEEFISKEKNVDKKLIDLIKYYKGKKDWEGKIERI
jgi:GTPase SAR1 family protein